MNSTLINYNNGLEEGGGMQRRAGNSYGVRRHHLASQPIWRQNYLVLLNKNQKNLLRNRRFAFWKLHVFHGETMMHNATDPSSQRNKVGTVNFIYSFQCVASHVGKLSDFALQNRKSFRGELAQRSFFCIMA
jgi:hypothetical protein